MTAPKIDTFTRAYITTALWSSTDWSDESGGESLDKNYDESDIAPESIAKMVADCARFRAMTAPDGRTMDELIPDDDQGECNLIVGDEALATLDQRNREAHAGPPSGWGHAELVEEVARVRAALGEACAALDFILGAYRTDGDRYCNERYGPDVETWRAIAEARP
jgi:hypothetical protein